MKTKLKMGKKSKWVAQKQTQTITHSRTGLAPSSKHKLVFGAAATTAWVSIYIPFIETQVQTRTGRYSSTQQLFAFSSSKQTMKARPFARYLAPLSSHCWPASPVKLYSIFSITDIYVQLKSELQHLSQIWNHVIKIKKMSTVLTYSCKAHQINEGKNDPIMLWRMYEPKSYTNCLTRRTSHPILPPPFPKKGKHIIWKNEYTYTEIVIHACHMISQPGYVVNVR